MILRAIKTMTRRMHQLFLPRQALRVAQRTRWTSLMMMTMLMECGPMHRLMLPQQEVQAPQVQSQLQPPANANRGPAARTTFIPRTGAT